MADFQQFTVTALGSANVNVPRAQITALVVEGGVTLADFTGANAIIFPAVIGQLTAAERLELAQMIAHWLVRKRAGLG